ncbi:hypothetical protein [Rugosimonospora africana]|uniref:Secreted protein n=1 Tax=Rugosimonospora africana TaxID=556532 RepID=A0A8J3VTG6_9ACTN|nr:hypothetical protein [Rugosimonospora africana]GIH18417.1 hypothetical protein Raf01_65890 [Rugosimonospora africana]
MRATGRRRRHVVSAAAMAAVTAASLSLGGSMRQPDVVRVDAPAAAVPGFYDSIDTAGYAACADPKSWLGIVQPPTPISGYLAGFANAAKLDSALELGYPTPALGHSVGPTEGNQAGAARVGTTTYTCALDTMELDHDGVREFPPATATFLTFGFQPVTATAHLTQVGPDPLKGVLYLNATKDPSNGPYHIVATTSASMRIDHVLVNGVPLDVGDNCHSSAPLSSPGSPVHPDMLVLLGGSEPGGATPFFAHVALGGALAGYATVPPFTGCVGRGGEDLDPLMTATISGADNYVKMYLSPLCTNTGNCTPDRLPSFEPYWTVTGGGNFRGTMTSPALTIRVSVVNGGFLTVTCPQSALDGSIPDTTGPPRGDLGTVQLTAGGCRGSDGSTWTVAQQHAAGISGNLYASDVTTGKLTDLVLRLSGTNVPVAGGGTTQCAFTLQGGVGVNYANPNATASPVLTLVQGSANKNVLTVPPETNTCASVLTIAAAQRTVAATYNLDTRIKITSP